MDGEEGPSPAEGETGYYETAQDSAFQFEPPRAPAHYGASRNSPSEDFHRAGSSNPWGVPAGPASHIAAQLQLILGPASVCWADFMSFALPLTCCSC